MKAFDISTSRQGAWYARESRSVSRRKTGRLAAQGGCAYREWPPAILVAGRAAFARQGTLPSRADMVLHHRVERRQCSEPGEGPGFSGSGVVIINRLFRNTGREVAFACRRGRVLDERALAGLVRVPWFRWGFTRRFVSVVIVLRAVSVGADGKGADG